MILKLCGISVLGATVAFLLGELGFKGRRIFSVLVAVTVLSVAADGLFSVVSMLGDFGEVTGIGETVELALKIIFVGYLFGFTSDLCSELGEGALAGALTMAGRVETFLLVLPKFRDLLRLGMELIG